MTIQLNISYLEDDLRFCLGDHCRHPQFFESDLDWMREKVEAKLRKVSNVGITHHDVVFDSEYERMLKESWRENVYMIFSEAYMAYE